MGIPVTPRVAVIGAGWAGLATAVRLVDAGLAVTVFEAARQAGGRARSVRWNDSQVDNGQHLLVGAYERCLQIMRTVGVDTSQALRRVPLTINVPGQFSMRLPRLPAPLHLAAGLLLAKGASLGEKLAAARFMSLLKASGYRLEDDLPVSRWLDQNDQRGTLRKHLWEPLCLAALNTDPGEASAQTFANVLRDTLGGPRPATDMLLPATDLGQLLPERAIRYIRSKSGNVELGTRIVSLAPVSTATDGPPPVWRVSARDSEKHFDHVVIATGAQHAPALLPEHAALKSLRSVLSALQWEPIATAYLQYPDHVRLPSPLIAVNDGMAQWLADRGQLGGPSGMLAHVLSANGAWNNLDNAALVQTLHADTNRAMNLAGWPSLPNPRDSLVIRERRATFSCRVGILRPASRTPLPGLWLAGDYIESDYPATLEAAVRSGEQAAKGIIGHFPRSTS